MSTRQSAALAQASSGSQEFWREVFNVDGHRVTVDSINGWRCECRIFREQQKCDHLPRARVYQAMRRANARGADPRRQRA
ncbi:MAG: hypothetical protein DIU56_009415 [Pseudomonadota bacterium]|nr:MAG: hypothetical protein DIU56_01760 [Pseudomonadota bacterium]